MIHENSAKHALILGCGYTGTALVRKLIEQGTTVWATTTTPEKQATIRDLGATPVLWRAPEPLPNTSAATVFILFPPSPHIGAQWLAEQCRPFDSVVYCSSTGVYGHVNGAWLDETSPVNDGAPRAAARLEVEQALTAEGARIVRAGGIYGAQRNMVRRLRSGHLRVTGRTDRYVNMIHVEDLAQILLVAAQRGEPGRVYNAVDGNPHAWHKMANTCVEATGLPLPEPTELPENPRTASFYTQSRRIRNNRVLQELNVTLQHPCVLETLKSLV